MVRLQVVFVSSSICCLARKRGTYGEPFGSSETATACVNRAERTSLCENFQTIRFRCFLGRSIDLIFALEFLVTDDSLPVGAEICFQTKRIKHTFTAYGRITRTNHSPII